MQPFANEGQVFELDPEVLARLDEEKFLEQLKKGALEKIEAGQSDPTQQDCLQRLDTKTLVKSDEEFARCLSENVPMRRVGYRHALHILAENEATHRNKIKKRKARKVTKASRKRNR